MVLLYFLFCIIKCIIGAIIGYVVGFALMFVFCFLFHQCRKYFNITGSTNGFDNAAPWLAMFFIAPAGAIIGVIISLLLIFL